MNNIWLAAYGKRTMTSDDSLTVHCPVDHEVFIRKTPTTTTCSSDRGSSQRKDHPTDADSDRDGRAYDRDKHQATLVVCLLAQHFRDSVVCQKEGGICLAGAVAKLHSPVYLRSIRAYTVWASTLPCSPWRTFADQLAVNAMSALRILQTMLSKKTPTHRGGKKEIKVSLAKKRR